MDLCGWCFHLPILHFRVSKCVSASKLIKITGPKSNDKNKQDWCLPNTL